MRKVKLTLEYDGTRYAGWQIQKNAETIQREVEEALESVLSEKVRVYGAGRTDAGVHALGQVAHFETRSQLPLKNIRDGANTYLPPDIVILRAEEVDLSFHARYNAREKIYLYRVLLRDVRSPLELHRACHIAVPLDVEEMQRGAGYFVGHHDFSAFTASGSSVKSKVRTISRLDIERKAELLKFEFQADGFLYKMVRNIVGTLLEVGKGKLSAYKIEEILKSGERKLAGPTAPASGLYFLRILYGDN
ncbi:MAG: tRNA pseudouridine(38-40) synthase TruA [Candidatus Euphemobacter frigidus]|nr:tRNA pseudouridine(38-40) synthase TruA [Candidatus Euphemobacter frigidus]MDP8274863.1 tRNA pseudouridine(38-40) synthase TruA [Candidatus Euphemobacter frigidus]